MRPWILSLVNKQTSTCIVNTFVGIGGPYVYMLLSLVNKEPALGLLIGRNLGRQGKLNRVLGGRRQSQRDAMDLLPEIDMLDLCW